MADNVTITKNANSTPPHGTDVATDDVGGVHYQRMKLDAGADGVSVPVAANADGNIIPFTHTEDAIREGNHFYISGFTTLADDGNLYVKLVAPNAPVKVHFRWNISATGILETNFYEGASGGMADGNDITPINNDRNSDKVSAVVITSGVTIATSKGTNLDPQKSGSEDTGGRNIVGGSSDRSDELILKQGETYFREFISTTLNNIVSFRASWIEI